MGGDARECVWKKNQCPGAMSCSGGEAQEELTTFWVITRSSGHVDRLLAVWTKAKSVCHEAVGVPLGINKLHID